MNLMNNLRLGFTRVSSNGEKTKPHCSSSRDCKFNAENKQKCAKALCNARGFAGAKFLSSSNNFCTDSFSAETEWVYLYDTDRTGLQTNGTFLESKIVANCTHQTETG